MASFFSKSIFLNVSRASIALLVAFAISLSAFAADGKPTPKQGYDAELSGLDYDFDVNFFPIQSQRQSLKMAYIPLKGEACSNSPCALGTISSKRSIQWTSGTSSHETSVLFHAGTVGVDEFICECENECSWSMKESNFTVTVLSSVVQNRS